MILSILNSQLTWLLWLKVLAFLALGHRWARPGFFHYWDPINSNNNKKKASLLFQPDPCCPESTIDLQKSLIFFYVYKCFIKDISRSTGQSNTQRIPTNPNESQRIWTVSRCYLTSFVFLKDRFHCCGGSCGLLLSCTTTFLDFYSNGWQFLLHVSRLVGRWKKPRAQITATGPGPNVEPFKRIPTDPKEFERFRGVIWRLFVVLDDYFHSFGGSCGELFMVNIFIAQLTGTGPGPNMEPSKRIPTDPKEFCVFGWLFSCLRWVLWSRSELCSNIFRAQLTGTGPGLNVEPSKSKNKMAPIAIYSTGGQLVGVD